MATAVLVPGTHDGSPGNLSFLAVGLRELPKQIIENPQPVFRDRLGDMEVAAHDSLPPEISATIGRGCGRRVLPYRMQDRYGRKRQVREFQSIVLENEDLKTTFLPELGGRLISLFHKPTQREL